jgi:glycosyltransferase involved in cell wall biosynthesis
MVNPPLVSILMTSYNRESYIAEAIESVIASTYDNWELIIVDDASKDRTVNIAREYEKKDSRIKLYVNHHNLGDYANRNKAATLSTGKYIKYLDSDDLILPNGLKKFVLAMEEYPNVAFALSLDPLFNMKGVTLKLPQEIYSDHFGGVGILNCGPSGAIIKRDIFFEADGFSEVRFIGDTELWLKISQKHSMIVLEPNLIYWREHAEQDIG